MRSLMLLGLLGLGATGAAAQAPTPLAVGTPAPDFALTAATKDGIAPQPLRLGDLRDQTVVIAFFYKARTRG